MNDKTKPATIKEVAQLAGVAPSTVSLVLNNSDKVREGTRQKVLQAVKKLNYVQMCIRDRTMGVSKASLT